MQLRKIITALLALLLAGIVIVPCVSATDNADTGNQDRINILVTITNNAQEKSDLNRTAVPEIKPFKPAPLSNLKKIQVPEQNESTEKQKELFSDRDWAFIRKSMTDLTEKEQDRMIVEMKKILDPTSSLSPDEPANVSLRMGYYILNATEGGKPVNSSDLPGLPKEKSAQTSASIPLTIPLIAMGGFGIFRHLLLGNNKKKFISFTGGFPFWLTSVQREYPVGEPASISGHPPFGVHPKGARKKPRFPVFPDFTG